MQFNKETPRATATIQGQTYTVPQPYGAGHTLNENEAAALNQLLVENVRNNLSTRVKKAQEDGGTMPSQSDVDAYVGEYEFGVRRGGGGGAMDPVEKEMRSIAREKVKEALRQKGVALKDVSAKDLNAKVEQVVTANEEKLRKVAEKVIKQREAIAGEAIEV